MRYRVNLNLNATLDVEANSVADAARMVRGICQGGSVTVTNGEAFWNGLDRDNVNGGCSVYGHIDVYRPDRDESYTM